MRRVDGRCRWRTWSTGGAKRKRVRYPVRTLPPRIPTEPGEARSLRSNGRDSRNIKPVTTTNKNDAAGPVASEGTAGSVLAASVQVGYAGAEQRMRVRVVGPWDRETASTVDPDSSTINALMAAVLRQQPVIHRILMLCGEYRTSIPFCVFEIAHRWFDCSQREVVFA